MIDTLKEKIKYANISPLQKHIVSDFINMTINEELMNGELQKRINAIVEIRFNGVEKEIECLIEEYDKNRNTLDVGVYSGLVMALEILRENLHTH